MTNATHSLGHEVRKLMADAFGLPIEAIPSESTPDNTHGWDSLSHLGLISAIESHFGISIPHEDAVKLLSETKIADYILINTGSALDA